MRLCLSLLLVTLALCSNQANATVCPSLLNHLRTFLLGDYKEAQILFESYGAPQEAVTAELEVKKCVDQMSNKHKKLIEKILGNIVAKCNQLTVP